MVLVTEIVISNYDRNEIQESKIRNALHIKYGTNRNHIKKLIIEIVNIAFLICPKPTKNSIQKASNSFRIIYFLIGFCIKLI